MEKAERAKEFHLHDKQRYFQEHFVADEGASDAVDAPTRYGMNGVVADDKPEARASKLGNPRDAIGQLLSYCHLCKTFSPGSRTRRRLHRFSSNFHPDVGKSFAHRTMYFSDFSVYVL